MRTIDPSIILAAMADVHVVHVTSRDAARRRARRVIRPADLQGGTVVFVRV